jgi:hypothetical protein
MDSAPAPAASPATVALSSLIALGLVTGGAMCFRDPRCHGGIKLVLGLHPPPPVPAEPIPFNHIIAEVLTPTSTVTVTVTATVTKGVVVGPPVAPSSLAPPTPMTYSWVETFLDFLGLWIMILSLAGGMALYFPYRAGKASPPPSPPPPSPRSLLAAALRSIKEQQAIDAGAPAAHPLFFNGTKTRRNIGTQTPTETDFSSLSLACCLPLPPSPVSASPPSTPTPAISSTSPHKAGLPEEPGPKWEKSKRRRYNKRAAKRAKSEQDQEKAAAAAQLVAEIVDAAVEAAPETKPVTTAE